VSFAVDDAALEAAREHVSALDAEAEADAMAAAAAAASVHKATEAEASSREHEQQRALQDRYMSALPVYARPGGSARRRRRSTASVNGRRRVGGE
jgi:hypothetical protein